MNSQEVANLDSEIWSLVRNHPVFERISDSNLKELLLYTGLNFHKTGDIAIAEGVDESQELFIVIKGDLEVIKKTTRLLSGPEENLDQFVIAQISAGDVIGEMSFIKGEPRSATIQCITSVVLLSLSPEQVERLEEAHLKISNQLIRNILSHVVDRLRRTTTNEVTALHKKLKNSILNTQATLFFSYVIGLLCAYNLAIHLIINLSLDAESSSLVSALIIAVFCAVLARMIFMSKLPLPILGLTLKNWKPALKESLLWTAVIIAGLILTKWILIKQVPSYQHLPLFDFNPSSQKYLTFSFLLYGLHSPLQEFVARGVLQGSLQHFFTGKNVHLRAILVSNALFSATHVHLMSGMLGVIVFIPGIFWGWLYARHENLIGVSISHVLIGWTGLFLLNAESLF